MTAQSQTYRSQSWGMCSCKGSPPHAALMHVLLPISMRGSPLVGGAVYEVGVIDGALAPVIVHAMEAREKFLRR